MRVLARLCLALALILGAAHAPAAQTPEEDRGYLQALLEDSLSDAGRKVTITGFEGALSRRAKIAELTIADADGVWLTMSALVLDWNRAALLSGRLEINELSAETIHLARQPHPVPAEVEGVPLPDLPPAEAQPFQLPELPVSVEIAKLAVARLEIDAAVLGSAAVLKLDGSMSLAGGEGKAALSAVRIDERDDALTLSGAFSNATRELDLALDATEAEGGLVGTLIGLPEAPDMHLVIAGAGPLSDFTATLTLEADGSESLSGQVRLLDEGAAQTFSAQLSGNPLPFVAPAYAAALGDAVALDVAGRRTADGGLVLDRMLLETAEARLNGSVDLAPGYWPRRVDVTGRIASATGAAVVLPVPGGATVLKGATLALNFDAAKGDAWTGHVEMQGFRSGALAIASAVLSGAGTIRADAGAGALTLAVEGLEAPEGSALAALGGEVSGRVTLATAAGAPITITGLDLGSAAFRLTGDGTLGGVAEALAPSLDGTFNLATDDLSVFAPLAGRPLDGAASVRLAGRIDLLGGGFDVAIDGRTVDLAIGIAEIDPLLAGRGALELTAVRDATGTRLRRLSARTDHARISAEGTLGAGQAAARITADLTDAARVVAGLDGPARLDATLTGAGARLNVSGTASGPGKARATVEGHVTLDGNALVGLAGQVEVSADSLAPYATLAGRPLAGAAALTASGQADFRTGAFAGEVDGEATGLKLGIETVDALMVGRATLSAALNRDDAGRIRVDHLSLDAPRATARLEGSTDAGARTVSLTAHLADMGLLAAGLSGAADIRGTATGEGEDWTLDGKIEGGNGLISTVRGTVAGDLATADLALEGSAPLALANAAIRPNALSGLARFTLRLAGPLAPASLGGTITTEGARLDLPDLRLALAPLQVRATLAGGSATLAVSGALSGGGRLEVAGPVSLNAPYPADLAITLADATLSEPGLYDATVAARLGLTGPLLGGPRVTGTVDVLQAELRIPDGSTLAGSSGLDIRHVGEPAAARATRARAGMTDTTGGTGAAALPLDIQVNAPTRLFVRGRGLDAELGGAVRLSGSTREIVPEGAFSLIRGRFDILGRRITLADGRMDLRGSLDPYLSLGATTSGNGLDVTFRLEGYATQPVLSVTSSPPLPEEEVLARLLFGRDVTKISAFQALQLASAVAALSGGGSGVVDRLRASFGFDDLDISTGEGGTTQVRVGRYLSEQVYSDAEIGSDGKGEISLNLSVTPSLTVKGRVNTEGDTGVGVFFERDY